MGALLKKAVSRKKTVFFVLVLAVSPSLFLPAKGEQFF
jgi:hypothetical protein